jgi:hypothetical protein
MPIAIDRVDHVVPNCRDGEATAAWHRRVLGLTRETFGSHGDTALKFSVRPSGQVDWWSVKNDAPGALDLCFITQRPPAEAVAHLGAGGVTIARGLVTKAGALGSDDLGLLPRSGRQPDRGRELSRRILKRRRGQRALRQTSARPQA